MKKILLNSLLILGLMAHTTLAMEKPQIEVQNKVQDEAQERIQKLKTLKRYTPGNSKNRLPISRIGRPNTNHS